MSEFEFEGVGAVLLFVVLIEEEREDEEDEREEDEDETDEEEDDDREEEAAATAETREAAEACGDAKSDHMVADDEAVVCVSLLPTLLAHAP